MQDSWREIHSAVSTVLRRQNAGMAITMGGALSIGRFVVNPRGIWQNNCL